MELYIVDAFSSRPFGGNPAAVCVCEQPLETAVMQQIAREMNLSETAFLTKVEDGYRLRWFTPAAEVKLCGHATLASAHILWETGRLGAGEEARFLTLSGLLTARKQGSLIELNFPAHHPVEETRPDLKQQLSAALGINVDNLQVLYRYGEDLLAVLDSEQTVRSLEPDFNALHGIETRGIAVTAAGEGRGGEANTENTANIANGANIENTTNTVNSVNAASSANSGTPENPVDPSSGTGYDCVSRFFCPAVGIQEDPVTGSAHCGIAPYWSTKLGKSKLKAFQASARGGELELEVDGDRVKIAGPAVTVLRGKLDDSCLTAC
ncbi:PhzF family phenazine biosynthesis protein [Paenibacillus physcomitrellae]|uniref:Phenazine biosynthesis protein n=1 Tax=Paenibacillus physcomitrellae TaxID=1619311 RepID=A0ABQ1GUJ1_9BACL|nr:PhzF family phenazine biosynthesis protein [Paenibacillus physcomitrellae]GGA50591.1 phenazine biosynthesis protein [Paenibacillus physcomitrellae]